MITSGSIRQSITWLVVSISTLVSAFALLALSLLHVNEVANASERRAQDIGSLIVCFADVGSLIVRFAPWVPDVRRYKLCRYCIMLLASMIDLFL